MAETNVPVPWSLGPGDNSITLFVDLKTYPVDCVLKTCQWFTDRCYVFPQQGNNAVMTVTFTSKDAETNLLSLVGDFSNELLNQHLREVVSAETRTVRELIVAQAFAEADLLDREEQSADYNADPRGISD